MDRFSGGAALKGLRLVTRRAIREWSAGGLPKSGRGAIEAAESGARWIHEQAGGGAPGESGSGGTPKDVVLCTDLDAASCSWMSAPSPDLRVVRAAAQSVLVGAASDDLSSAGGPSSTWLTASGELGVDESVQGLSESGPTTTQNGNGAKVAGSVAHRQRMGVLAIPDLGVRTLLDAMDALGRPPLRVISLWHAMAEAWGTPAAEHGARKDAVAEHLPAAAVVLIDPDGRLCWCWSRGGRLLAAGSLRLRRVVATGSVDGHEGSIEAVDEAAAERGVREVSVLEVSRADIGRIVSEWLAWGMELGVAPSRVVCLGPARLTVSGLESDLPGTSGVAAVGESLARGWPGAAVIANVVDDPIAATLQQLIEVSDDQPLGMGELEELSSRPGKVSKRFYQWAALALVGGAVAVGALGFRFARGAAATYEDVDSVRAARTKVLDSVKGLAPTAPTHADPAGVLKSERDKLEKAMKLVLPERPIMAELARLLKATSAVPGMQITMMKFNPSIASQVVFDVPDSQAWQQFQDTLNASPKGPVYIEWVPSVRPDNVRQKSVYQIQGQWHDPQTAARPGGGA